MCKVLKVSRSGFYKWFKSEPSRRVLENKKLKEQIIKIYQASECTYGSPRMTEQLLAIGWRVSRPRVARIMRKYGIRSVHKRKFVITTDSKHNYPIAKNLLNRRFNVERTGQVWVSDITYIRTRDGWRYLTAVMDLADRKIIGWSISRGMQTQKTVIPAMKMALCHRPVVGPLIFHSDQGIQYASNEFRSLLKAYPLIKQSMSRRGNCWDNAVMESFFKTLKVECIYQHKTLQAWNINAIVIDYIERWYNRRRLHSALGYKTPAQVEEELNQCENVA